MRETDVQKSLRSAMEHHPAGEMQTAPEQVQFIQLLLRSIRAQRAIEIGVFTGYSALGIALALPPDGKLIACDLDANYLKESRAWWMKAGIDSRIESRLGPGKDTLTAMLEAGEAGSYDFMYVDADKESAVDYFNLGLQLLRPGGLYTVDNMFRGGRVADPAHQDESTIATRALVDLMAVDDRIDWSLVPIGDGLGVGLKR
ncbi:MAG: class I SAM-dependent methyltransferase [Phycisphaerales bacterium]|nr:class I SAM-dependent methyltransferase [Phycisphaerales bacterium]